MQKYCPKCFKKFPLDIEQCPEDGTYLVAPMDKDLVGEVLDDRYTVLERIGKGGMGVVYRAEQHLIKRIVALKVLRREIVQDESAVKRFLNEARAIASLDSRHTITLHDFGVTRDGLLYYTMELLKGRPLSRIILDEAPLDHVRAAGLLLQACRSLEEAHEHNILHRDLKPENLFVSVKKGKEQLKVLDFGIAKLLGDSAGETVTQAGMIVGTPQYLSPEQARGNPVAQPSDLYSLGIVFYEMLAGEPPFLGDTPMQTLWAHIQDPVPPLHQKNPKVQVPRSIEAFLVRALEKDPSKRFQSARSFAEALRKAVEDHDASPETVTLPPLATTDQGLRLSTQAWTPDHVESVREGAEDGAEVAPDEQERGTALLEAQGAFVPAPTEEPALEDAPEATSPSDPPVAFESAETAWALETPREEASPPEAQEQTEAPAQPQVERPSSQQAPLDSSMDDGLPGAEPASQRTMALAFPKRNIIGWSVGALAIAGVLVGVLVWAPWEGDPPPKIVLSPDEVKGAASLPLAAFGDVIDTRGPGAPDTGPTPTQLDAASSRDLRDHHTADQKPAPEPEVPEPFVGQDAAGETRADDALQGVGMEVDRQAEEATRQEAERARQEAEKKAQALSEARRKEAEEQKRKAAAEAEAKMKAEAEAKKKAAAEVEAKRKAEAEEARRREEAAVPKSERLLSQARAEMRKGQYEQALERLASASEAGGAEATIGKLRGECYVGIKSREVKKLLVQAQAGLSGKDYSSCLNAAGKAVKLDPGDATAKALLKECKEKKDLDGMKF